MFGSCCGKAFRAESVHRRRSRSLLTGKGGVALRRFSQTCRDLFRDPGTFFSLKLIILGEATMIRRQFHEESAGRYPRILQTKTSAKTSLTPRISVPKTASPCLAAWQRFEQRLGHLCGPIDGVPIAINPRNDEAALHYSYEHQRKLAGVEAFRNFAVGLSFEESSWKYRSTGFLNEASAMDDSAANLPILQPLRPSRKTLR